MAMVFSLGLGVSACSSDISGESQNTAQNPNSNLSDRNVNAEFKEGAVKTHMVVLPNGYQDSRSFWNYKLAESGMENSQMLFAKGKAIAVKQLADESKYRIVVIDTVTGETKLDAHANGYVQFNPAIITEYLGKEYLNIISTGVSSPNDGLSKGEAYAMMSYVDLTAEQLAVKEVYEKLGGLSPKIGNDSKIHDEHSGYPYVRSGLEGVNSKNFAFSYSVGPTLQVLDELPYEFKPLGVASDALIYSANITGSQKLFQIGEDIDLLEITGFPNADQLYWAQDGFALVGTLMHTQLYLIDIEKKKVIAHHQHKNTVAAPEEYISMENYDVSDNREYVVFGNYAVDVKKGQLIDMTESDSSKSVTFTHVDNKGVAYGMAADGTVAVTLDIPSGQTETNVGDSTQAFGYVRDSFDNGSLLVEAGNDIFVVTKD